MKKYSKLLALICALLIVFAMFAACAKKDEPAPKEDPPAKTEEKEEEKEEVKEEEETTDVVDVATANVVTYKSYTGPIEENLDYYMTTIGDFILQNYNAKLEIWPASETTYREELVTDMATDSLPDFLSIWVYPNAPEEILILQKAAKEGLLAGLNDAVDKHAPTIKAALTNSQNYPIYTQEYMADPDFEGETYFLPTRYSVGYKKPPGWSFVIRDDIRAQLDIGDDPIYMETFDEYLDILRQVKALEPLDINDNPAWASGGIRIWTVLMAAYTRLFDWGGVGGVDVDDTGKLVHFFDTEYPWQQIVAMRKLFDEGLMDPEALTHTFEVGREKVGQGKYVVESFFAAGGTDFSYHKPTVAVKPEMTYSILGSFYTNKGSSAPLLTNNLGMQTHFLNAVSMNADLDVVMPILEFFASPTGTATNAYGVEGLQWDWDSDGMAVIKDDASAALLEASEEIPHPYVTEHGTGTFGYISQIPGINIPEQLIFAGTDKPRYPMDPSRDDEIDRRIALATNSENGGLFTANKLTLASFMQSYPDKDAIFELLDVSYLNLNLFFPAYLAEDEEAAREIFDDYKTSVKKAGLDNYISYLQDIYDEDPDKYLLYESLGG